VGEAQPRGHPAVAGGGGLGGEEFGQELGVGESIGAGPVQQDG
jgi:hypothetical protein